MKRLILASNSPRRKDLLEKAGFSFEIISSNYEEKVFSSNPIEIAKTFAEGKASDVFNGLIDKEDVVVLGADTVVCLEGQILGKASSSENAKEILRKLSNKEHIVVTGCCLISSDKKEIFYVVSKVKFNNLNDEIIDNYINSGLYKGKAGAYGIQDGFGLVESFNGSLNNIIGLPIEELKPTILDALNK